MSDQKSNVSADEVKNDDFHRRYSAIVDLTQRLDKYCQTKNYSFCNVVNTHQVQKMSTDVAVGFEITDPIKNKTHWQEVDLVCQQHGKQVYVITDNLVEDFEFKHVKILSVPEIWGILAPEEYFSVREQRSKLYNCLIRRSCPVRQSWLYFLKHHNLLDQGYVSYLLKNMDFMTTKTGAEQFEWIHHNFKLNELAHFDQAYKELIGQVPYRNFENQPTVIPYVLDSKYSLIIESTGAEDDRGTWLFTEKTIRTLQLPTYPLLFAQRRGIQKLKELGFQLAVNHDHLDALPWTQRQQALLDILVNDTVEFDATLLTDVSQHNYGILCNWRTQCQREDFFDQVFDRV